MPRTAKIHRKTAETTIDLSLDLDGSGQAQIDTGVGFFDHMLTLLAKHSLMDLTVKATGDLHVDHHHTVEDTGICLGKALAEAAGRQKRDRALRQHRVADGRNAGHLGHRFERPHGVRVSRRFSDGEDRRVRLPTRPGLLGSGRGQRVDESASRAASRAEQSSHQRSLLQGNCSRAAASDRDRSAPSGCAVLKRDAHEVSAVGIRTLFCKFQIAVENSTRNVRCNSTRPILYRPTSDLQSSCRTGCHNRVGVVRKQLPGYVNTDDNSG